MDLDPILNMLLNASRQINDKYGERKGNGKQWQMCVGLSKLGWRIKSWNPIKHDTQEDYKDNVMVVWAKEGYEDISVELGVAEQYYWLKYISNLEDKNG
jgi:hypothetical protein